jgi:dynein light intermediate chain 1
MNSTSGSKRRKKEKELKVRGGLALGYEVLEIRDEGDEGVFRFLPPCRELNRRRRLIIESAPPLSIYYPPSSHSSFTKLVPTALPPKALSVCSV